MKKYSLLIGLGALFLLVGAGCSKTPVTLVEDGATTTTPTTQNQGPIRIGVSAPLTGEAASFGDGMTAGAELAKKEINEKGGVNGRMIELVFADDRCDNKEGLNSFNKLVNVDKVDAIVGPICSAAAGSGLPVAKEKNVPTIVFGSAPNLPGIGENIFRTYPSDSFQGVYAADFIKNTLGKSKVAVLYVQNDWGQGIRDVFVKKFQELGGQVVFDEGVTQDVKDLRTPVTKLKEANPEVIYFPAYPAAGVVGLKQLKEQGVTATVVGGDAFGADEVIKSGVAEGLIYTLAKINNPEDFAKRAKDAAGGKEPIWVTPLTYDAINILAGVFTKVGTEPAKVIEEMKKVKTTTAISLPVIEFDELGDLKAAEFELKQVKSNAAVDYKK